MATGGGSSANARVTATSVTTLRDYQSRIASKCESDNTLVVLPTGSGKTLIAAEVIKQLQPPALFLVPTCLLVDQQADALRSWTGLDVTKCRGGLALPQSSFAILVSTPEAFRVAQQKGAAHLQWAAFRVVIFDEVHHVLKDHPYRKLALSLRRASLAPPSSASHALPRVVGLTASYSYAIGDAKTAASLTRMCHELLVTNTETATREELEASGYHATGAAAEVLLLPPPTSTSTMTATPLGVVPEADRKPHMMGNTFFRREAQGTCTDFTRRLMRCVRSMEEAVVVAQAALSEDRPNFSSPLPPSGKLAPREWGAYAHELARKGGGAGGGGGEVRMTSTAAAVQTCTRCGAQLIKIDGRDADGNHPPSSLSQLLDELEHWYEAVKTLVVSWEEREDDAATILDMFGCTGSASHRASGQQLQVAWPERVRQNISEFWSGVPPAFARHEHLKEVLLKMYDHHGGDGSSNSGSGNAFRGIVFVRQRVTTHVLAHAIASDPRLKSRFSTACLYASSSPATASLSVTKAQAQARIEAFRFGRVNLLLTTVVAEEGMDIPAANCVIRYDSMVHPVSLVQGRGRAREEESSFVVLDERPDRTTADLEAIERQQQRLLRRFTPPPGNVAAAGGGALAAAQRSRERGARAVLLATVADDGEGALSALNLFSRKTKAVLEDSWEKGTGGSWVCTLSYHSPLRKLHATGTGYGKKAAKKLAAAKVLADLRQAVPA